MKHPLTEVHVGSGVIRAWVTERGDESVHPMRVDPRDLRARQSSITGGGWAMSDQVHGVAVLEVDGTEPWSPTLGVADVLTTAALDVPLAVWAADCAPIVLAADDGTLVGAHGGWRGLAAGVLDVAVERATANGGTVAVALLGPVIHPCCYEFGDDDLCEVASGVGVDAPRLRAVTSDGRPALDVPAAVAAGLARHDIALDVTGPCSGCDDRWFSHRVRADTGRHALVVERVAAR